METRANYILVGAFTLAVIVGAFGFVYWFHHVGGTGERSLYRIVFQGPIGGLRIGATVSFNGIRVGEVTELTLDPKDPKQALATISVDKNTPVRADTEVTLDYQGLTGIAALSLKGGAANAAALTAQEGQLPVLTAGSSASQDLMQAAREAIRRIDTFIADNEKSFRNSVRNIESFTDVLSRNSDKIDASIRNIETFTGTLARNSEKIDRIMAGMDNMIGGPEGKGAIPDAALAIKSAAENLDKKLDGLVSDGRRTLGVIERAVKNFDENPTRLIFGGGRPATAAAPTNRRRQQQ
jgi:phospholipid/cholesterol/gamma-HCH transport system substrate-binding protein